MKGGVNIQCVNPNFVWFRVDENYKKVHFTDKKSYLYWSKRVRPGYKYMELPCGKCMACRLNKARE